MPTTRREAVEALRVLFERVARFPDRTALDGLTAELQGDLAEILALAAAPAARSRRRTGKRNFPERVFAGSQLSVVAGARNRRSHKSTVPI